MISDIDLQLSEFCDVPGTSPADAQSRIYCRKNEPAVYIYIQKACFRSEIGIFNLEEFSARNCAVVTPFWFLLALHVVVAFADGADRLVLKH